MKKIIFLITLFFAHLMQAQDHSGWEFVPSGLLFRPLVASTFEPRVGIFKMVGRNTLRLDIGNSVDLIGYTPDFERSPWLTIGADFFTYTRIQSEERLHFPVDAVDYLFGINAATVHPTPDRLYALRLRVSHISAHFVDGHYSGTTHEWKNGQPPRVYSREFLDLTGAVTFTSIPSPVRVYTGGQYLTNVDPRGLPRLSGGWGAEISSGSFIGKTVTAYAASDFRLMRITSTTIRTTLQAGCKLGAYDGRGIDFFVTYFNGMSIHGEYYDIREEYTAFGVKIDF